MRHPQLFGRALTEVVVLTVSSWIPLLLLQWRLTGSASDYGSYYGNIVDSGQLIILAISMFGAILWSSVLGEEVTVRGAQKWCIGLSSIGILVVVFVFGENPSLNNKLHSDYAAASQIVYWLFVLIQLTLAYQNRKSPPLLTNALKKGSDDLMAKYDNLEGAAK